MEVLYDQYALNTCDEACICIIPPAFGIEIEIPLRIIRVGDGGYIEELVGGEWVTPTGDYEQPEIEARTESTAEERRCLAAINAATVYEQFYEEATDAFTAFSTPAAVAEAILDAIIVVMGLFGQATAASHISFGQRLFSTFVDAFELVTGDVWTGAFTDELACILYENSTDTSGVVTFDYNQIQSDLIDLEYAAGGDLDRQLLLAQVRYLLSLVAGGGVDIAGTVATVTEYDCTDCNEWSQVVLDGEGQHGFSPLNARPYVIAGLSNCTCTYASGPDEYTRCYNGQATSGGIYCFSSIVSKTFSDTTFTRAKVFPDHAVTTATANAHVEIILKLNGSVVVDVSTVDYDTPLEWTGSQLCDEVIIVVATQNTTGGMV